MAIERPLTAICRIGAPISLCYGRASIKPARFAGRFELSGTSLVLFDVLHQSSRNHRRHECVASRGNRE
jgi:hypothetical protein